jgi:hypothetical protein
MRSRSGCSSRSELEPPAVKVGSPAPGAILRPLVAALTVVAAVAVPASAGAANCHIPGDQGIKQAPQTAPAESVVLPPVTVW